jgi:PAS domain S-box-containing protein
MSVFFHAVPEAPTMPTPQDRLNLDSLKDVLSLAVRGAPFDTLLERLLQAAHALTGPDTQAAIYVADDAGALLHLSAAAGLAPGFSDALRVVPVGADQAACGRAAALRTAVLVEDILLEPRMVPYLGLARDYGVRACWSFPLHAPDGHVLGTLAFYHGQPRSPDAELSANLAYFADMAALVIERHLREQRSARREAEAERRRRLYEVVLGNTPDLVYVFDLDHRFTYANAVLLQMWGRSWDDAIGKNCLEIGYPEWHAAMHGREIEQVKATRKPIRGIVPFDGAFGLRYYDYIFTPVLGLDGEVEAIAGTTRDVTEIKQAEEALLAASQRKDEFLAMLAHELRNPLAPISAAAQVLRIAPSDGAKVRNYAELIGRQVSHMTALVNDLLDVSRVTRGMVQFDKELVDLRSVIASAAEQLQPLVDASRHTFVLDSGSVPAPVSGDRARLIQVVANLLANAAKYTPPGGRIALTLDVQEQHAVIRVRDDGSGIDPALLPHVFELFTQGKRTPDRAQGGLGLGLALARTIVAAHDGRIEADSAGPGQGSCFTVTLPLAARGVDPAPLPAPGSRADAAPLHIMLVDDNLDAAATLSALLEAGGHRVTTIADPTTTAASALRDPPDVFILDIGMPGMDGHQLARRLRHEPLLRDVLYIALTGYGQPQDRELSRRAGFDHHLVKPLDPDELVGLLNGYAPASAS